MTVSRNGASPRAFELEIRRSSSSTRSSTPHVFYSSTFRSLSLSFTMATAVKLLDTYERLKERTAQRAATGERKKKAAELLKEKGNEHYKNGRFDDAVKCYEDAIIEYGPRVVYLNNLTAALLKLERYEEAEATASQALHRDHKLMKARFRRGVARKNTGYYRCAIIDFENVLKQDPTCEEARVQLKETETLFRKAGQSKDTPEDVEQDAQPMFDDPDEDIEPGYTSDSSDFFHTGNGTPCRFYNHDGCARGTKCLFRHAPDDLSVRDKLGRNVCILYLLGMCKYGDSCHYAHEKRYLQRTVLDDASRMAIERRIVKSCLEGRGLIRLEAYLKMTNINECGSMCIPRLRRETFDANRLYRSPWSGILDYEPDADEVPDWSTY
ncbi:hypothetical protein NM688_g3139 [Phlebia brevispora]|uniref:Uncharacterized protein n=1 Tax=Phlebia brevispora TaxID=194682 RepID=A0ACC1T6I8_9APHY|nr:hypothetical protein NM688_g3139 [Phlebia brevispora]